PLRMATRSAAGYASAREEPWKPSFIIKAIRSLKLQRADIAWCAINPSRTGSGSGDDAARIPAGLARHVRRRLCRAILEGASAKHRSTDRAGVRRKGHAAGA